MTGLDINGNAIKQSPLLSLMKILPHFLSPCLCSPCHHDVDISLYTNVDGLSLPLVPPPKLYNFHHEPAPNLSEIVQVLGLHLVCLQPPQTPTNKNIPHDPPSHEVPPLKLECIQPLNDLFKERGESDICKFLSSCSFCIWDS